MKILVIGNGFDIAHGLQTRYEDFLNFIKEFKQDKYVIKDINKVDDFSDMISDNAWINYFMSIYEQKVSAGENGWIDFEREISRVVQKMEELLRKFNKNSASGPEWITLSNSIYTDLRPFISQYNKIEEGRKEFYTRNRLNQLKEGALNDLNRLTHCLEIYLTEVENANLDRKLPDIEELGIDRVLSFNYTNTFQKIYDINSFGNVKYDYIHGKAETNHDIDSCNLVLGIDEYLDDIDKNKNTEFIQFKKYYQRIFKKTGCIYKSWITEAKDMARLIGSSHSNGVLTEIYIIGHSMDITDKDVLRELIDIPMSRTTIFYHNKESMGKLIENMVKLIGQDQLIERVYGDNATIVFKELKPSIMINEK